MDKEYYKDYYHKNRERILQNRRKRYQENPEKQKEYTRRYWIKKIQEDSSINASI